MGWLELYPNKACVGLFSFVLKKSLCDILTRIAISTSGDVHAKQHELCPHHSLALSSGYGQMWLMQDYC